MSPKYLLKGYLNKIIKTMLMVKGKANGLYLEKHPDTDRSPYFGPG